MSLSCLSIFQGRPVKGEIVIVVKAKKRQIDILQYAIDPENIFTAASTSVHDLKAIIYREKNPDR